MPSKGLYYKLLSKGLYYKLLSKGPYHEGSEVILVCEAGGGKPTPQVLNFVPSQTESIFLV